REFKELKSKIPFALGKDIAGKNIVGSIEKMPHLLVAGATGSGKSVCINSLIMSILYKARPDEVKLILIDPKVVELNIYNGIPHLLIPVVTDPRKASNALNWAVSEMTTRYKIFAQNSVRDIFSFNDKMLKENRLEEKMPQIVIIIDELADLMQVAPGEVEECITRIAQLARACGIHLVIATQRPSVDVITGTIKANIPSRIAFAVSSYIDSRTILDASGAEKLLGKGDMLYHPMGMPKPIRIQGTFISDDEIKRVVEQIVEQKIQQKVNNINAEIEKAPVANEKVDDLLEQVIELVVEEGQASASYLQRRFSIGYNRAARLIDALEERGIISGYEGSKPRKVLITKEELEEMKE
ncbi:MAG TPA: DNA translocase FtsK, partial [Flavobacteriaceae bacterium]|nr:DNA translocase FtsK [Flavobacteriaceae bacterium]